MKDKTKKQALEIFSNGVENYAVPMVIVNLRKAVIEVGIPALLGPTISPVLSKVIAFFVDVLFDRLIIPTIQWGELSGLWYIDREIGAISNKQLNEAEQTGDTNEFDSVINSL